MHELAQEFIERKKKELSEKKKEEIKQFLISNGLFEKIYADKGEEDSTFLYPYYDTKKDLFYYEEPIRISEEEYEELKKYTNTEKVHTNTPKNSRSFAEKLLKALAYTLYTLGFIGSISILVATSNSILFLGYLISVFIGGTVFYGFGEIIRLLNDIKNK